MTLPGWKNSQHILIGQKGLYKLNRGIPWLSGVDWNSRGHCSLIVRATGWDMGDWGSIPGLGEIFDPWICLNESFPVDDYLSQDWLLCRDLIRMVLFDSHLSNWKSSDYKTRLSVKKNRCKVNTTLTNMI